MTVYYDDLVFTGPYFQPAVWGGHASPAYADDLVYQPPITNVATQFPVSVNFVGSGVFAPATSTPLSAFASFAASGAFVPTTGVPLSASVNFAGSGVFTPVPFGIAPLLASVSFSATGTLAIASIVPGAASAQLRISEGRSDLNFEASRMSMRFRN